MSRLNNGSNILWPFPLTSIYWILPEKFQQTRDPRYRYSARFSLPSVPLSRPGCREAEGPCETSEQHEHFVVSHRPSAVGDEPEWVTWNAVDELTHEVCWIRKDLNRWIRNLPKTNHSTAPLFALITSSTLYATWARCPLRKRCWWRPRSGSRPGSRYSRSDGE